MKEFWYHSLFIIVILVSLNLQGSVRDIRKNGLLLTIMLGVYVTCMIGFFPVPWNSGADRELYAHGYKCLTSTSELGSEALFGIYSKLCRPIFDYQGWFILTALIYCFNHAYAAWRCDKEHVFFIFLMWVCSFSFFSYGINTLRAGFAASFLLLALVNYKKLPWVIGFLLIAINCHFSMVIPAIALVVAKYWNKPKLYIGFWGLCVLLSAVAGGFFETIFAQLSPDARSSYLNVKASDTHYVTGFRLDFILYSLLPIVAGYYYLVKRQVQDEFYSILLNTYILANSFWVLVIRANFSDRFAYLSWFIYPLVLIYPALKFKLWKNQYSKIAAILFGLELFTYFMFIKG